jgi:hypothetical protein
MPDKFRFYIEEQLSENIGRTPEGFLICKDVPITRIGEFLYKESEVPVQAGADGLVRIQRDEPDVFAEDTIKSFEGKPVTIDHPDQAVTPDNWSDLAVGHASNVRRGDGVQADLLLADLTITTAKAIELIEAGLREISCGYDANYEQISEGYGRQKDIVGNHVALVMKGRAGARCAIADKECTNCGTCNCQNKNVGKEVDMKKSVVDKLKSIKRFLDSIKDADLEETEEEKKKKAKDAEELPKKLQDIKDKHASWYKDVESGKLDVSKLPIELKEIKDEVEGSSKKDEKETERAKEAKDADEEQKKKDEEAAKIKASDKKFRDQEGKITGLVGKVKELVGLMEELAENDDEAEEALDKKMRDAEEAEKEKEEEKAFSEKKKAEDAWPDLVHRVEVLNPGMRIQVPTKDHAKIIRQIKLNALKGAYTRDEDKPTIEIFVKGGLVDKLTNDGLDAAFIGASELIARGRNGGIQRSSMATQDFAAANTVRAINEKNKAFYAAKTKVA